MNIYDIAEKAGVSIATVSRVINKNGYVSLKTKEKVMRIIEESEYLPHNRASLKKINNICILTEDIRIPSHAEVIYGIEQKAFTIGICTTISNTGNDPVKTEQYIASMNSRDVDAYILTGTYYSGKTLSEDSIRKLTRVPVVAINGLLDVDKKNVYHISRDEAYGAELAASYFLEKHHRHFGIVCDTRKHAADLTRRDSFIRTVTAAGETVDPEDIFYIGMTYKDGYQLAEKLAAKGADAIPTAFYVGQGWIAAGLVNGFRDHGIAVPEQVSIIGVTSADQFSTLPVTVIDFNMESMGVAAVTILDAINAATPLPKDIVIRPTLIERESVIDRSLIGIYERNY